MVKMPRRVCASKRFGEVVQVEERIVADGFAAFLDALAIVQREVESHLRVGEGRHEDGHVLFEGRFQDAASFDVLVQVAADLAIELPRAGDLVGVPLVENFRDDALDEVQVGLRLQRVVNAVVAGLV